MKAAHEPDSSAPATRRYDAAPGSGEAVGAPWKGEEHLQRFNGELLYDPAAPLLDTYPGEMKT